MRASIVMLSVFCFSGLAFAEKAAEKEDCSGMIRANSVLPAKLAELLTQVSANMEGHAKWMSQGKDGASKAEVVVLKRIARQQQAIAALAKKLAADMASVKLEPAPHDMSKADPKMMEHMASQARLEGEMADLLRKSATAIGKMVAKK